MLSFDINLKNILDSSSVLVKVKMRREKEKEKKKSQFSDS
jgi:hypothetical protein